MDKTSAMLHKFGRKAEKLTSSASMKIQTKLGMSAVSDKEFDEEKSQYSKLQSDLKKLQKSIKRYNAAIQEVSLVQEEIAASISKIMAENDISGTASTCTMFTAEMNQRAKLLETDLKGEIVGFLRNYLVQFKEIEKRIQERNARGHTYERAEKELRTMDSKSHSVPAIRTDDYKMNRDVLRENFDYINNEVKKDMILLKQDSTTFVSNLFPVIAAAQLRFFIDCKETSERILGPLASYADLTKLRNYPHVITSTVSSSMYRSAAFTKALPPTTAPLALPPSPTQRAKALYSFVGTSENELTFNEGDIITILSSEGTWWTGQLNGREGQVPYNYVELIYQ